MCVVAVSVSTHSQLRLLQAEVSGAANGTQQLKKWVEVSGWIQVGCLCEAHQFVC